MPVRRAGLTVRFTVDYPIAACAIRNDLEVLHRDRDFEVYNGLGIRELRICRPHKKKLAVEILTLRRGRYAPVARSKPLPDLDIGLVTKWLEGESQAALALRIAPKAVEPMPRF